MIKTDESKTTELSRKDKILREATILFYHAGYDNTSIRELSEAAGISVAGIYYFFKDKEEILFSILHQAILELASIIKTSIKTKDDPKVNIRRVVKNVLTHAIEHKMEIFILNREDGRLNASQKETIFNKRKDAFTLLKKEVSRLAEFGELKTKSVSLAVFTIFSMTTWVVRWYDPNGAFTLEEIADNMTNDLLYGIVKS